MYIGSLNRCRIIGLYVSLVLVVGKFMRMWTEDRAFHVMLDELPSPDYLLGLCKDIYISRERREWCLEEELFAKLLFLFRSPEMLIRMSHSRSAKVKRH